MRKYEDGESNREEGHTVADNFHDAREVHLGKGILLLELCSDIDCDILSNLEMTKKNYEYKQKAANRF